MWQRLLAEDDPGIVLRRYLRSGGGSEAEGLLHEAAKLELVARSTTALFLRLYRPAASPLKRARRDGKFVPFRIREDEPELLADVQSHLRRAAALGGCQGLDGEVPPSGLEALKRWLLVRHRTAKPEGAWIDERWRTLRPGLGPRRGARGHAFRLVASQDAQDVGAA